MSCCLHPWREQHEKMMSFVPTHFQETTSARHNTLDSLTVKVELYSPWKRGRTCYFRNCKRWTPMCGRWLDEYRMMCPRIADVAATWHMSHKVGCTDFINEMTNEKKRKSLQQWDKRKERKARGKRTSWEAANGAMVVYEKGVTKAKFPPRFHDIISIVLVLAVPYALTIQVSSKRVSK
jgi:hypothetical protein